MTVGTDPSAVSDSRLDDALSLVADRERRRVIRRLRADPNGVTTVEDLVDSLHEADATESLLTDELVAALNDIDDDVSLVIGTLSESLRDEFQAAVPKATTFVSGLEWLQGQDLIADETAIGRLLLVDRSTILVSSIIPDEKTEQAIFGEGFGNGLVVIARRLMSQGLIPARDPQ